MSKPTIASDVTVNEINEKAAAEKHNTAMRTLPSPTYVDDIPWDSILADKEFNVRLANADYDAYSVANNRELFDSLKSSGLIKRDPMAFSRSPNGTSKVLAGHLRHAMMYEIRKEEITRREKEGLPADPDTLPFAYIHGLVYDNLSHEQETLVMADHVMRKDLTEPERAKEIAEFLRRFPISEVKAAVHFGLEKSKLQRLKMRYLMPTVYDEFVKEKTKGYKGAFYKVDQKTLTVLYSQFLIDQGANNNAWRVEGPAFRAAWSKFVADTDIYKGASSTAKDDPRKETDVLDGMIVSVVTTHGDRPEVIAIRDAIRWAGGRPGDDGEPVNLTRVIEAISDYCDDLRLKAGISKPKPATLAQVTSEPPAATAPEPATATAPEHIPARKAKK